MSLFNTFIKDSGSLLDQIVTGDKIWVIFKPKTSTWNAGTHSHPKNRGSAIRNCITDRTSQLAGLSSKGHILKDFSEQCTYSGIVMPRYVQSKGRSLTVMVAIALPLAGPNLNLCYLLDSYCTFLAVKIHSLSQNMLKTI